MCWSEFHNIAKDVIDLLQGLAIVGGSIWAIFLYRNQTKVKSLDLLLQLEDRFEESKMVETKRAISLAYLSPDQSNALSSNKFKAEEIFDFFETLGLLMKRGSLEIEDAYNSFFNSVVFYKTLLDLMIKENILEVASDEWRWFDWISARLKKKYGSQWTDLSGDNNLARYAKSESAIES